MTTKSHKLPSPPESLYEHLATTVPTKSARTLLLNAKNFEKLIELCEATNADSEAWNAENQKLPKGKRQAKRKKIRPCDIIDDLIAKHLNGEA